MRTSAPCLSLMGPEHSPRSLTGLQILGLVILSAQYHTPSYLLELQVSSRELTSSFLTTPASPELPGLTLQ